MLDSIDDKINKVDNRNGSPKLGFTKVGIAMAIVLALGLGSCDQKKIESVTKKISSPTNLKGRKVNDLYSYYLGYGGGASQIGDTINFNPNEIIKLLYEKKFQSIPDGFEVAKTYYENIVSKIDFSKSHTSNIEEFRIKIKKSITEIRNNFNRDEFCKDKLGGNKNKLDLFKKLCNTIDENSLIAYSMTELFPAGDGKLNKEILDFILQNGGEEFVYNLPAVNDDYASFGPYQLTSKAVYDVDGKKGGVSVMNHYLPKETRIPGSVTKLRLEEHHKAAYLFAMYNIYTLLKSNENQKALNLLSTKKNDIVQLIAIMHNKPCNGVDFLQERYKLNTNKKYLKKKTQNKKGKIIYEYDINNNGSIDLYESKTTPITSHGYGKKTYYNKKNLN